MKTVKLLSMLLLFISSTYAQQINVALHKPAEANSESPGFPAKNVTDGLITRNSKWMSANVKPPHILEINLQKYCVISSIIIHTGIPDAERTPAENVQAAGYWSAKNFKLQYWDDANWTDIPGTEVHENRLTDVKYSFAQPLNTYKIRFVCDDGEPISITEIEAFGTENATQPVPESNTSGLKKKTLRTTDQDVNIKVENKVTGKSMRYVGYNQGYYMPGSNASGWMEYANVNSVRVWITLNSYAPLSTIQVDKGLTSVDEFDKRKHELRQDPEHNAFLKWDKLLPLFSDTEKSANTNPMIFSYTLTELKRLHIDPIIQFGSVDFNDSWGNKWQQWQRYYALAYYAAKMGDVTMFAMQNEPNHKASGPMKLDQWIAGMKIVSDALKCAIEDVNKRYNKHLKARMVGPVTAGNNPEWWAAVAKNQRTDYHEKTIDNDLLGIFSTHSYNSPAAGYATRVNDIRKILVDNHPQHQPLPIVYTEIGRWMNAYLIDKEETMDSPSLFTEWAGIYTNNTKNQAYGMWAFKFSNTSSETYPFGVKSGHHFTWQGQRIVEDAYKNLAMGKTVTASYTNQKHAAVFVTDGNKTDRSVWYSDSSSAEKWLEIDLGSPQQLGSSVVYTGSDGGTYTAPDRVKNFKLQYWDNAKWTDIAGTVEQNNRYAQVFRTFKQPVTTSKIRFVSNDPGVIKVREIKVFGANDGPVKGQHNYDVSGIQRTGEVVRLFATGFKDERPLLQTTAAVDDQDLDCMTSYDAKTGNYYMWLVQRGLYKDHLNIDLSALPVKAGTPVTAQTVSPAIYGEVSNVVNVSSNKSVSLTMPLQSVVLLTIPSQSLIRSEIKASDDATVMAGGLAASNMNTKVLTVALNAAEPNQNAVTYMRFNLQGKTLSNAKRILLKVNGYNATDDSVYRFHVYGIPVANWQQRSLTWNNAPQLHKKEALITGVGQKAFIAGELAMDHKQKDHYLDVTQLVKSHATNQITFVFVRETRQLGDDSDKGKRVLISSSESANQPELIIWSGK